ncbi:MAG: hypothetical protein HGA38_03155 [Candidatus Moranbacteria bacterium]|nr:hypothetical protein [Candidatus Moranbacteria bacterium]
MENDILHSALGYLERGFSVIPIDPKTKKALVPWAEFQKRHPSESEVRDWWERYPSANVAVVTGRISGLVVVDIEAGGETRGYLPTVISKTGGGGWHFFYAYPEVGEVRNRNRFREMTDIRGEGGYVVMPPSLHASGNRYEWSASFEMADLVEFPIEILTSGTSSGDAEKTIREIAEGVGEGERNDAAARYAGHLFAVTNKSEWESVAWPKLKAWNEKNRPPLPEEEVRRTFESIAKLESVKRPDDDEKDMRQIDALKNVVFQSGSVESVFVDQLGETYVRVHIAGHSEVLACESGRFRSFLVKKFNDRFGDIPTTENVNRTLSLLVAEAEFGDLRFSLDSRVARDGAAVWYDPVDPSWKAIRVDVAGWRVVDNPPTLFRRSPIQDRQVDPVGGGDLHRLLDFVNISDPGSRLLFLVSVVANFIPDIARPVQMFHGTQGAAKSTASMIVKRLTDPAKIELISLNADPAEMALQLSQHYLISFDNMAMIDRKTSDMLCRAVTGGGFSKRKLYRDVDNVVLNFKRAIVLNGINAVGSRPDLLDRSLLFQLERIPESERKSEEEFWGDFEREKPALLGAAFDVLSKAMGILPSVKLKHLPRMADFARWGYAIAEALGDGGSTFMTSYRDNIAVQNEQAVSESPVAALVLGLMRLTRGEWKGDSTSLLKELRKVSEDEGINAKSKDFPVSPSVLSRRLNEIRSSLQDEGVLVEKSGQREWCIRKVEEGRKCRDAVPGGSSEPKIGNDISNDAIYGDTGSCGP